MTGADLGWFREARFGMFIHWGIYAAAARHEWVQNREEIPEADYRQYFDHFSPDLYDPAAWAEMAWDAGMRYLVVTSKHHDGFCLWDSALTDFKAPNTPYGRDILRPMLDAFRDRGLRTGLYYSLIDWHHDQFPIDGLHPQRGNLPFREGARGRDMARYREYMRGQVRELLTGYGPIDIMWFDFSYSDLDWEWSRGKGREDWDSEGLVELVRSLCPSIVLNDRLEIGGDIRTPEQYQPADRLREAGHPVAWEACQTMNGSWGYDRDNLDWKSGEMLVRLLIDAVSKDGNMLLNVGPTARGTFEPRAVERLRTIGEWMRLHERAIRGCGASEYSAPVDCRYTQRGDRLYLHLFAWPFRHVHLPDLAARVEYAQFLHDASEVRMTVIPTDQAAQNMSMPGMPEGTLTLELPVQRPDVAVPVVELFLRK